MREKAEETRWKKRDMFEFQNLSSQVARYAARRIYVRPSYNLTSSPKANSASSIGFLVELKKLLINICCLSDFSLITFETFPCSFELKHCDVDCIFCLISLYKVRVELFID